MNFKKTKFQYQVLFLLLLCLLGITGCRYNDTSIPSGKARLTGQFSKTIHNSKNHTVDTVQIAAITHFTDAYIQKIPLNKDGSFVCDIPVVCSTVCEITLNGENMAMMDIVPGRETEFKFTLDEKGDQNLEMIKGNGLSRKDYDTDTDNVYMQIYHELGWERPIHSAMTAKEYNRHIAAYLKAIDAKFDSVQTVSSETMKAFMIQQMKLSYLTTWILGFIELDDNDNLIPFPLKKASDYSCLQYFNLADSSAIHEVYYAQVFRKILSDTILNIPPIEEMPVKDWLNQIKPVLSGLIRTDTGFFYDILAANAISKQFYDKLQPLSDKQIEQIKIYFKESSYTELLLLENERIKEIEKTIYNETPAVPPKKLMDTIVSHYKGNVVVVDFWATWCGPCLQAMREMEPVQKDMENASVVYVYLTNPSSPETFWKQYVYSHRNGQHYYLTTEEWNYLMDEFGFNAIPSYLLYDTTGQLKYSFTGFRGVDKMRKMIMDLLP